MFSHRIPFPGHIGVVKDLGGILVVLSTAATTLTIANECPAQLWADFLAKLNSKGKNFDDFRKNLPWRVLCRQLGYTDKHEIDLLEARCIAKKNARPTRPLSEGFPQLAS